MFISLNLFKVTCTGSGKSPYQKITVRRYSDLEIKPPWIHNWSADRVIIMSSGYPQVRECVRPSERHAEFVSGLS